MSTNNNKSKNVNTLWDKTDIVPLKPDAKYVTPLDKAWTFAVADDKHLLSNDDKGVIEKLVKVSDILASKEYALRYIPFEPNDAYKAMVEANNGKEYKFNCEGFLPWKNYDRDKIMTNVVLEQPTLNAYRLAMTGHTKFLGMKPTARAIYATRAHTILGTHTNSAVSLFICYSEKGETEMSKDVDFKALGNLVFYFRLIECVNATKEHIKVINLANEKYEEELNTWLSSDTSTTVTEPVIVSD